MLKSILEKHTNYQKNYKEKEKRLEARIDSLTEKRDALQKKYRSWIKTFVSPLAKELQKYFPEYKHFELLGPFGLRCNVSIHFFKKSQKTLEREIKNRDEAFEKYFKNSNLISLTIIPISMREGEFHFETGEMKQEYGNNTLGDINGMNNVTKGIVNIEELVAHLKKQIS
jgi:hypothetical protein